MLPAQATFFLLISRPCAAAAVVKRSKIFNSRFDLVCLVWPHKFQRLNSQCDRTQTDRRDKMSAMLQFFIVSWIGSAANVNQKEINVNLSMDCRRSTNLWAFRCSSISQNPRRQRSISRHCEWRRPLIGPQRSVCTRTTHATNDKDSDKNKNKFNSEY